MFDRIIVPLDGSRADEAALAATRELAHAFHAQIVLVQATPQRGLPSVAPGLTPSGAAEPWEAPTAETYIHEAKDHLRRAGFKADVVSALPTRERDIAGVARLTHADLVVMATHPRWNEPAAPDTDAALDLLVNSRVPLMTVHVTTPPENEEAADERVPLVPTESALVVALDGTPNAETALPVAEALAQALGLYVVLVRAVSHAREEAEARTYLLHHQVRLNGQGIAAISKAATGDPLSVIEAAWRESNSGLIVMTSRGRSGPHGSLLGSLAARMIEEVEAPMLVLRPQNA